ncbi:hypothetical protein PsorP6_000913 [Peronosclerospora sorghi]|uniref:Uncharacterized protein n=1 Tax=Peronosclerospora sorghi TaxID=230839 RepID=A0ACC0WUG5_9STRA|nr:hypothetical protein PsorP6_000913 [Peronosclerospora sorghi]
MKDAVVVGRADKPANYHMNEEASSTDSLVEAVNDPLQNVFSPTKQNNRVVETVVGFMAKTSVQKTFLSKRDRHDQE